MLNKVVGIRKLQDNMVLFSEASKSYLLYIVTLQVMYIFCLSRLKTVIYFCKLTVGIIWLCTKIFFGDKLHYCWSLRNILIHLFAAKALNLIWLFQFILPWRANFLPISPALPHCKAINTHTHTHRNIHSFIHSFIRPFILWIQKIVTMTIGCGISHKNTSHTDQYNSEYYKNFT
jgi:hypothetical protein